MSKKQKEFNNILKYLTKMGVIRSMDIGMDYPSNLRMPSIFRDVPSWTTNHSIKPTKTYLIGEVIFR